MTRFNYEQSVQCCFVLATEEEEVKSKVTTTKNEECILVNQVRRITEFI